MELDDAVNPLGTRRQERSTEVQRAFSLAETATSDCADTGSLKELHAVELISLAALGSSSVVSLLGQLDGGEEIHGALRSTALNALHLLKGLVQGIGTLAKAVEDGVVLLVVELVGRLSGLGRVDHDFDEALADDGGAEHNGDKLVDVGLNCGIETDKLKVAATVTALANHALGDAVEGSELDAVVFAGILLLHLAQDALEAVELANEDVGLVDLISHENQVLLAGKVDDGADVLFGERGTRGVTGVDDNHAADINALSNGLVIRGLDGLEGSAPVLGLVEVIGNGGGVENSEGRRVERVLGDRDHNTTLLVGADNVEQGVNARRGTRREEDVVGVGGESVTLYGKSVLATNSTGIGQ